MGFLSNLFGGRSLTEVQIRNDASDKFASYDFPDLEVTDYIDYSSFAKFRELSDNRRTQYQAYDEMTKDIIISSALEMYADDASQYDTDGKMIWADTDDKELKQWIDDLLEDLDISKNLWSIYYSLAEYGDVYIKLFKHKTTEDPQEESLMTEGSLIDTSVDYEDYVEICDNPEDIFDLIKNGKTCQYAVVNKEYGRRKQERIELYPPDQFVHMYINRPSIRDKQVFEFTTRDKENDNKEKLNRYKVRRGKSMLHDIYAVEKEIQLLENSVLLNRLTKSAMTRSVSVEVGDMPKPEVRDLLRRVKSSLESKLSVSTKNGIKSYNSPGQLDNIIVSPTRNGKGAITVQNIGGDVDVKSLIDLDYFNDKRFGGLKIPKAFLGFDEALGSNAGGTLTKMDARYGRTIKRLQTCVVSGLTDLVNLYLLKRGKSESIGNFKIRVVSPTTVEDLDRDDVTMSRLNLISSIMSATAEDETIDKVNLLSYLLTKYMDDPEISKYLNKSPAPKEPTQDSDNFDDEGGE